MKQGKIIEAVIKSLPNCSPITEKDKPLYEEFLKTERKKYPYHYSRNWIFIKQVAGNFGIKYFNKEKQHLITIAPNWGGSVPNYVYLPLGIKAIESVPYVVKELAEILEQKIIVKKIYGEDNKNFLLKNGFKEIPPTGNIDFEHLDDDRYPEVICDVDSIIKAAFGFPIEINMREFRYQLKDIYKKVNLGEYNFQEKELDQKLDELFKDLVKKWSQDAAERLAKQFKKKPRLETVKKWMFDVYYPHFVKEQQINKDKDVMAYISFIDGKVVGFTAAYPVSNVCLAVNGLIADTSFKGLIRYLIFRLANKARVLGYKYINLGSNDTKEQYEFKLALGKIYEVQPYIFEYK